MVSMELSRCRFIWASWNSNSKSDTARSPRIMAWALFFFAKSTVRPVKDCTSAFGKLFKFSWMSFRRSSVEKVGFFSVLMAMAMMTLSKRLQARLRTSRCP